MRFIFITLCALLIQACGGSDSAVPTQAGPSPTHSSGLTTPGTPSPTATPIAHGCLEPDPPLVWAVAQRIQEAPPFSGLVLRLNVDTREWAVIDELAGLKPTGISFVDCEWGWRIGTQVVDEFNTIVQRIDRTTDGGASWSDQAGNIDRSTFAGGYALAGVRCTTRDRCMAFGQRPVGPDPIVDSPPLILRTTDGGATWRAAQIVPAPEHTPSGNLRNGSIFRLCLTSSGRGLASGYGVSGSLTLLTDDGGESWRDITASTVGGIACAGERELWSVGEGIRRSRDGGTTWENLTDRLPSSASEAELSGPPSFIDAQRGWLLARLPSGAELVLQTTDGGDSWTQLAELPQVPGTTFDNLLVFATATVGVTSGRRTNDSPGFAAATITRDGGGTWATTTFSPDVLNLTDLALVPSQ